MRDKDTLRELDETRWLMLYLYADEKHTITANNGLTDLKFRMTEDCEIMCQNLSFPDFPETSYTESFSIPCMLGIIEQLKSQPPEMPHTAFKSRWDEIKTIAGTYVVLNSKRS